MNYKRFLYRNYCFYSRVSVWRRGRFSVAGTVVIIALFTSAGVGLDTTGSTAYQIFTLLSALLTVSFCSALFFRSQFKVLRTLPQFTTVDETLSYQIEVGNLTSKQQLNLFIQEETNDLLPSFEEFINTPEPGEEKRNAWDRKVMFHRFIALVRKNRKADFKECAVPTIAPKSRVPVKIEMKPQRRGPLHLKNVIIKRPDPFGLIHAFIKIPLPQNLIILPKRYQLPHFHMPGLRKHHSGGIAQASSVGNADEFLSLREYRPGDPMRQIHWKSLAKTGDLIIKENEDEFFIRHALILDTFGCAAYSDLFEEAVSLAASFACTVLEQESLLDLMFVEDKAYRFSSGRNIDHTGKMLEILACVSLCIDKPFSSILPMVITHAPLLSGSICILLKWDEERKALVQNLRARNLPVLVLLISDPKRREATDFLEPTPSDKVFQLDVGQIEEGLSHL